MAEVVVLPWVRRRPPRAQHIVAATAGGGVGQAAFEDGFHQRVSAGDDVADDEDIGLEVELAGVPAFVNSMRGRATGRTSAGRRWRRSRYGVAAFRAMAAMPPMKCRRCRGCGVHGGEW